GGADRRSPGRRTRARPRRRAATAATAAQTRRRRGARPARRRARGAAGERRAASARARAPMRAQRRRVPTDVAVRADRAVEPASGLPDSRLSPDYCRADRSRSWAFATAGAAANAQDRPRASLARRSATGAQHLAEYLDGVLARRRRVQIRLLQFPVHLFAVHLDGSRRLDTHAHDIAPDVEHSHDDIVTDHDALAWAAG